MKAKVCIIVAMDPNGVIGKDNSLPWLKLQGDLPRFKALTNGYPIIMGSTTALSIGKPLPGRQNIVITRNSNKFLGAEQAKAFRDHQNIHFFNDLIKAIDTFKDHHDKIFIIGGGEIYKLALELGVVDEMIITETYDTYEGDTYFKFDKTKWKVETLLDLPDLDYRYRVFRYFH